MPVVLGFVSFDSWLLSRRQYYRDQFVKDSIKKGIQEKTALEQAAEHSRRSISDLQNNISATSDRVDTANQVVNDYSDKISICGQQLAEGKLQPHEVSQLQSHLQYLNKMRDISIQKQAEAIKELQALSGHTDPEISKSYFSDLFNNFTEFLKDYVSIISSEQQVILFNLSGYMLLLMILTTITTLLIGDHLILYFKLESKYPKLAKYIKFQVTLREYQLRFYIAYFYFIILILISVNIFMFTYDYL